MSTVFQETTNNDPQEFTLIADGVAGNREVVRRMIRVIRDSVMLDKGMNDFAAQLITDSGLSSHSDPQDIFELFYNFVRDHVEYISDNAGRVEKIKDGRTTLRDGYGDCDDQTILVCTLLAAVGYEPKIALAKYGTGRENFDHVYCVVYAGGERSVLDTTLPDGKFDEEVEASRIEEIGVFDHVPGVDDLGGIVNGVKDMFSQTGDNALRAASELGGLLPIGLIPAHLLGVGASMLGSAKAEVKRGTLSERGSDILGKIHDIIIDLQNHRIAVETALAQAKAQKMRLYDYDEETQQTETFKFIEGQINNKIRFIENYGATNPGAVTLNYNAMLYLGIALVGVVGYFALKERF